MSHTHRLYHSCTYNTMYTQNIWYRYTTPPIRHTLWYYQHMYCTVQPTVGPCHTGPLWEAPIWGTLSAWICDYCAWWGHTGGGMGHVGGRICDGCAYAVEESTCEKAGGVVTLCPDDVSLPTR